MIEPGALRHHAATAIAFLRLLYPTGPWVLTSIEIDRQGIATQTFHPDSVSQAIDFIERWPGRNLYYSLNRPTHDLTSKAARETLAAVHYLHVDVDPRIGEDLQKERERIAKLVEAPPNNIPRPTAVVYSGGGYNAIWRLDQPIAITGESEEQRIACAEDIKRYNIQLEWDFGGDHCHNVDRILRLPGSVNWPDAKKRGRGRVPTLAKLLWFDTDAAYPIDRFIAAPLIQTSADGMAGKRAPRSGKAAAPPGNVRRLSSVDELGDGITNRTKALIVQGCDPDDPTRTSRSEILFHVCCDLVRGGITRDVIYSVITDPDFGISKSVLDKRGSVDRYANRQIDRAEEEAVDPALRELNDRHAVIENIGGKCLVAEEITDPILGLPALTLQDFSAFNNRYNHRSIQIGQDAKGNAITMPLGKWWLGNESRRQYRQIVFSPEREVADAYNLWTGFAVEAKPGTGHERFLAHVRDNLCAGDPTVYRYLLGWMASVVQHPAQPGQVAIVLRGSMGTGKSFFATTMGALFGRHYKHVADAKHIVGNFNAHLRDCVILFGDEAFYAGDKRHESVLKMLITERSLIIERKGINSETGANHIHLIMASNSQWVVPAGHDERRFLVLDVSDGRKQDIAYFKSIVAELANGGHGNLLWYLRSYDLSDFEIRSVPKTRALDAQKLMSLSSEEEWFYRKLYDGVLLADHPFWEAPIRKDRLEEDYLNYAQKVSRGRIANATALGNFLRMVIPKLISKQRRVGTIAGVKEASSRAQFWEFPSLVECRAGFDLKCGGKHEWPVIDLASPTADDEREAF